MLGKSYFDMLSHYKSKSFEKHFTNALIQGLRNDKDEWEDIEITIEASLRLYKEEGKQLFYVADIIKEEILNEIERIQSGVLRSDNNRDERENKSVNRLNDLLGGIVYNHIDYYEVAKVLTRLYKENQKTKKKLQLKAA